MGQCGRGAVPPCGTVYKGGNNNLPEAVLVRNAPIPEQPFKPHCMGMATNRKRGIRKLHQRK
ncbi:hypothetical protein PANO111632_13490 [Paracoccus nototheniae]